MMSSETQSDAIAYVRLHLDVSTKYRTRDGKAVRAPTGRTYYFDGPLSDGASPWVPVYPQHREDLKMFDQYDAFEIRHEEGST
jgi:hypothetical protein